MTDLPPGMRRVDPDAEVARLAEECKRATVSYLLAETHQVMAGDHPVLVTINVAATEWHPVPHDLGYKIADVIRANWPMPEPSDG